VVLAIAFSATVSPTFSQQIIYAQDPAAAEFLARWQDKRIGKHLGGAFWTAAHDYTDRNHMKEVERFVAAIANVAQGDGSKLAQLGGMKAFKERLSVMLNENEPTRALAATLLGACGDKSYTDQIAALLKPRKPERDMPRYDRGRAAMALGLLGAKQYTLDLVRLLKSSNDFDRAGAALGLGALKATEYRRSVAALLKDSHEGVRNAAKESLEMMRETANK
jgi:HEAT repeat protein